jgi:uncharacterized damage-inducible protein DinB
MSDRKQAILDALAQGREHLTTVLGSLQPDDWEKTVQEGDQNWTVRQIVTHLADAQKGMTGQMTTINSGQEAIPADFDLDRWNKRAVEKGADKTPEILISALDEGRVKLLQFIDGLSDADMDKQGRHSSLKIMTIEQIALLIASHEVEHAQVIADALGLKNQN